MIVAGAAKCRFCGAADLRPAIESAGQKGYPVRLTIATSTPGNGYSVFFAPASAAL